jgi:LPXTG-motif cell wall-anchored protein
MRGLRNAGRQFAIALAFVLPCAPALATQYWELDPQPDPSIAIGTYTVVGGKAAPDGVNFTLKNSKDDQPIALTLIATTQGTALHLSAFKDDGESFLDKDTDAGGLLTIRFRTADTMNFKVSGPVDSTYQLALWRGPSIVMPSPDPVVAMDALTGRAESAGAPPPAGASATANPAGPATGRPAAPSTGSSNLLIYLLLGGIMLVLIVIAFLLYRGQKTRGQS